MRKYIILTFLFCIFTLAQASTKTVRTGKI